MVTLKGEVRYHPLFLFSYIYLKNLKTMAKPSKLGTSQKVSFGTKKTGVFKKKYGPKCEKPKKYRGQGR